MNWLSVHVIYQVLFYGMTKDFVVMLRSDGSLAHPVRKRAECTQLVHRYTNVCEACRDGVDSFTSEHVMLSLCSSNTQEGDRELHS